MTRTAQNVAKARTGIAGLDELTEGGIPLGRTTLVNGGTGTGKTILAMQCLAHGAHVEGENGVFLSFGESVTEARENGASLGLELAELETAGKLIIDSALLDPDEDGSEGEAALEAVFVRLEESIERIGAKRVAIDAISTLGQTLPPAVARARLKRMLTGLKRRGVTSIVTREAAGTEVFPIEEYLSDCVIRLQHPVDQGIATRRLRIVKYRGSPHRLNEYPFLISSQGITVTPVAAVPRDASSDERVSIGIAGVDAMLAGGVYRGSTVLVTGTAGAGKTSVAVSMGLAACARGERCLLLALEEQATQITRNMQTIGLNVARWTEAGLLRIRSPRFSLEGLEAYLVYVLNEVEAFGPHLVLIDPLTPIMAIGRPEATLETIIRLLGILKSYNITVLSTLFARERFLEERSTPLASFADDIIALRTIEEDGERMRTLSISKARGIAHSSQVRAFRFTEQGIDVLGIHKTDGLEEGEGGESA